MSSSPRFLAVLALVLLLACSGRDDGPGGGGDEDAGGGGDMDAGGGGDVDSGGGGGVDAGGGGDVDAGGGGDVDAGGGGDVDAGGGGRDGGLPCVDCPPPIPGCRYEGGSCRSCGTLVCEMPDACVPPPCPAPPPGCHYEGTDPCVCGTLVCDPDAGGPTPGGCTSNADCAPTDYCDFPPGACAGVGTCQFRPEICITVYDPVCGCDGVTYSNACNAAGAGQNVASSGECGSTMGDCRSTGCPGGREECMACRCVPGGVCYVCLPRGTAC